MDIHAEFVEPVTPGISYENVSYWKTEDSGYHTSFTPGSLESSGISGDTLDSSIFKGKLGFTGQFQVDCYDITPDAKFRPTLTYSTTFIRSNENYKESPQNRRGTKRVHQEESETDLSYGSIPTPTSILSGGLRQLRFSDTHKLSSSFSPVSLAQTDLASDFCSINENILAQFPTTPIKKICRTSCKLNSPLNSRKPSKALSFTIHSLSCDTQALQKLPETVQVPSKPKAFHFKPNQRIDIIKLLYKEAGVMPPIMKIFNYLSNEDIYNFTLVSPLWQQVWETISKSKKQDYLHYLKNARENQENKMSTPKDNITSQIRPLMEIHNVLKNNNQRNSPISPPGTPKTIRFKRYAKAASMDMRKQLSCVRCRQPAKVTEEVSGEEWVECTSVSCSYQFCRFCKCDRHPGKNCFQYDLDGPSPSKRKKSTYGVNSKKSRRNLRRLL